MVSVVRLEIGIQADVLIDEETIEKMGAKRSDILRASEGA